jgi:two-component system sensor histidine kinase YesM
VIPILVVIQLLYSQGKNTIQNASADFIQLYVSQLNTTINNYVMQVDYTSRTLFSDYAMLAYLQKESTYSTGARIDHNLSISRQLLRFADQLPFVEGVMIISNEGNIYSTGTMKIESDYAMLSNQRWFQEVIQAGGQLTLTPYYGQTTIKEREFDVFTAGRLIKTQQGEKAGIILFELSSRSLISLDAHLFNLNQQYEAQVSVHNKSGELLFNIIPDYPGTDAPSPASSSDQKGSILSTTNRSPATGISVTIHVPKNNLYKNLERYKNLSLLVTLFVLILIAPASIWISYHITKPIHRLISSMRHVEYGRYRIIPHSTRRDEFGVLTRHYNEMILTIKHLIEDVYASKIKQNEAQYLALQNQINPHWLNNTLESIRMEAQINHSPTVAEMIKKLGKLFQLALSKSNQPNRIRDEIEYIEIYVALQNIRFNERFKLCVDLEYPLYEVHFPKLVFQPLIENSIMHGFLKHDRNYTITIEGYCTGNENVVNIRDDGEGMTKQMVQGIRDLLNKREIDITPSESLGLRNISTRLLLHYGEALRITIDSEPGRGTTISLTFPLNNQ